MHREHTAGPSTGRTALATARTRDAEADAHMLSKAYGIGSSGSNMTKRGQAVDLLNNLTTRKHNQSGLPMDAMPFVIDPRVSSVKEGREVQANQRVCRP